MNKRKLTDEQRKEHLKQASTKYYSIEKNRIEKIRKQEIATEKYRSQKRLLETMSFKERANYMLNLCNTKYGAANK